MAPVAPLDRPWEDPEPEGCECLAFAVQEGLLVTDARCVQGTATVEGHGAGVVYRCLVTGLALLLAEDLDLAPVRVGGWASVSDSVSGFAGGVPQQVTVEGIELFEGVPSMRLSDAIDRGSPLLLDGRACGVAQGGERALPACTVLRGMRDYALGRLGCPVPSLGISTQPTDGNHLHTRGATKGALVTHVSPRSCLAGHVRVGDVVTEIDGSAVGGDGRIGTGFRCRLPFDFAVALKLLGDDAELRVSGRVVRTRLATSTCDIKLWGCGADRRYFIHRGLLFQPLTSELFGSASFGRRLERLFAHRDRDDRLEELVVLTRVCPTSSNVGKHGLPPCHLVSVDGVRVTSLRHAWELVQQSGETLDLFRGSRRRLVSCGQEDEATVRWIWGVGSMARN